MTARELFGPTLRQQRERQGLTLAAIAKSTKISRHVLASLERGDVSAWPRGFYRRAFVRAYAAAVGLPPEPTVSEFVRHFPEPGQDSPVLLDDDDPRRLRLSLVTEPRWKVPTLRSAGAVIDSGAVVLVAAIAATLTSAGFWMSAGLAALAYHAIGAVLLGGSPGAWLMTSSAVIQRPQAIRDQVARLRQGWVPDLLDPAKGDFQEHGGADLQIRTGPA